MVHVIARVGRQPLNKVTDTFNDMEMCEKILTQRVNKKVRLNKNKSVIQVTLVQ